LHASAVEFKKRPRHFPSTHRFNFVVGLILYPLICPGARGLSI
jgi:hypothetical protein